MKKNLFHQLEEFISDPDLIKLEQNLKTFNLMKVFKISTSETAISAFLGWIFTPNEDHGIGDYFLRYFLMECAKYSSEFNVIEIDGLSLSEAIVKTEENFSGKKADITIRIDKDKFLCLIENKIKSSEGIGQTEAYVKLSKIKYRDYKIMYVFLTPSGIQAEAHEFFLSLKYTEVKKLLNQTIEAKKHQLNEEILLLLNQFIHNLEVNVLNEGKIREMCEEIYERHKGAIDTIVSYKPKHMDIIESELNLLLDDEWDTHTTKGLCYVFKKKWLQDFEEFFYNKVPFFNYVIWSYPNKERKLTIDVLLIIEKTKIVEIREAFSKILDEEMDKNPPESFSYIKKQVAQKFREHAIEGGYETKEDLKEVAKVMKNLIEETLPPLEKCISTFRKEYDTQIKEWKEYL